ncbi:MAG TPA: response regulator transcription factor [Bacteroidia bacterium]|nr:response regulator transcription factor [Bacteroidia bacterium]
MQLRPNASFHVLLVAEPKADISHLDASLQKSGFNVRWIRQYSRIADEVNARVPDVILLDTQQKDLACFEICHSLKSTSTFKHSRILILSEKEDEHTEVAAFNSGADDFILRPVKPEAMIRRILARVGARKDSISLQSKMDSHSHFVIDRESYSVYLNQRQIMVSRKEFELLHLLASQPGKVFSRDEIVDKVWNRLPIEKDRTIDVHILRLRRKLGNTYIHTQKGVGYRFII